ncbi:MAG: DUF4197 domain-containing protein [Bacteroidales bacterium]|nr:DUF4197 domain-containing protein [Bacteroidales bacterium]
MKQIKFLLIGLLALFIISCDESDDIIKIIENPPLTEEEVVAGLKEALVVGTDTAVSIVSEIDGYYMDELIRILMPPDADIIMENIDDPLLQAIGIDNLVEDVVLLMNRAAEDAATEAIPIFVDAVTSMTIQDAFNILNGEDTAATHYLRENTYTELQSAFQPKIGTSLEKPLVGGVSADEAWSTLTTAYNNVAQFIPGWNQVNTELDEYVTRKALDGLFVKVAEEEIDIREDPLARVTDLLKRVFGGN